MTANGQIDPGTLTPVRSQPYLRLTAATEAAFAALRAAVYAAYGWWLTLTDAYRDYPTQERIFRQRFTTTYLPGRPRKWWLGRWWYLKAGYAMAATPGTSNHGWGTTVDIAGLGGFGGARYRQLASVAPNHGWSNAEGAAIGEAWHWNHTGGTTVVTNPIGGGTTVPGVDVTPPAPLEEDALAGYTDKQLQDLAQQGAHNAVLNLIRSAEFKKMVHDQAELALREQLAPSGEAHKRLIAALPTAVLTAKVSDDTGTVAQTLRDTRRITRRFEAAWRKLVGLPADPTKEP